MSAKNFAIFFFWFGVVGFVLYLVSWGFLLFPGSDLHRAGMIALWTGGPGQVMVFISYFGYMESRRR